MKLLKLETVFLAAHRSSVMGCCQPSCGKCLGGPMCISVFFFGGVTGLIRALFLGGGVA